MCTSCFQVVNFFRILEGNHPVGTMPEAELKKGTGFWIVSIIDLVIHSLFLQMLIQSLCQLDFYLLNNSIRVQIRRRFHCISPFASLGPQILYHQYLRSLQIQILTLVSRELSPWRVVLKGREAT